MTRGSSGTNVFSCPARHAMSAPTLLNLSIDDLIVSNVYVKAHSNECRKAYNELDYNIGYLPDDVEELIEERDNWKCDCTPRVATLMKLNEPQVGETYSLRGAGLPFIVTGKHEDETGRWYSCVRTPEHRATHPEWFSLDASWFVGINTFLDMETGELFTSTSDGWERLHAK